MIPPQLGAGQAGGPGKPPHPGPDRDGGSKASQASSPKKAGGKGLVSLKGDRAFQRLKKGRSGRGRLVLVRWLPRQEGVAVGIVVSKKVGKAVVRNKVRRRIREILRRLHLPPADLLVIAQPEAKDAGFAELARDLFLALKKSGLVQ
ncbi:ribonuclease P protein component [Thermus filiformis]|uniref:ribonuclease P protein component n=1 Tax=Thermus filiformis TaxID=276 RepID=UPI000AFF0668|nr:ribonuclease P protein component [Thermus filiformis]